LTFRRLQLLSHSIRFVQFVSFLFVPLHLSTFPLSSHLDCLRPSSSNRQRIDHEQPIGNGDRIDEERQIGKVIELKKKGSSGTVSESMTNKKSK
jgi:hypothetical protein